MIYVGFDEQVFLPSPFIEWHCLCFTSIPNLVSGAELRASKVFRASFLLAWSQACLLETPDSSSSSSSNCISKAVITQDGQGRISGSLQLDPPLQHGPKLRRESFENSAKLWMYVSRLPEELEQIWQKIWIPHEKLSTGKGNQSFLLTFGEKS